MLSASLCFVWHNFRIDGLVWNNRFGVSQRNVETIKLTELYDDFMIFSL
uniref:Uncharacterized protein n=1 Tax=Arundo donax TaxID=35708 RepID=A0A0A9HSF9_ARUDO